MADWKKINAYALAWDFERNRGKIRVFLDAGQEEVVIDSPMELAAIADILRNESEAYFDSELKSLRTGFEMPGDSV